MDAVPEVVPEELQPAVIKQRPASKLTGRVQDRSAMYVSKDVTSQSASWVMLNHVSNALFSFVVPDLFKKLR